jgi:hypothetical protein
MQNFSGDILALHAMKPAPFYPFLDKLLLLALTLMLAIGIFLPGGTVQAGSNVFPLAFPMSDDQAHITDGIIAWGVIIVTIIFIGVLVGGRGIRKPRPNNNKSKRA